jgi:Type II CAAX prenyl endopeptidase Rce1-like
VLVATMLVTLLVDGVVNPTVEELYFRGYLLPRLPVAGWRAIPVSAGLFTTQHYWQPENWLLIFVLELLLTSSKPPTPETCSAPVVAPDTCSRIGSATRATSSMR